MVSLFRDEQPCLVCLSCLRSCPTKAIALKPGQIIEDRCIHCRACLFACPEGRYHSDSAAKFERILSARKKIALVSALLPSVVIESEPEKIAAALCEIGFDEVYMADSGLEILAREYQKNIGSKGPCISSQCPPVTEYIEKFYPDLVDYLAPVVSPETAAARYLSERIPGAELVLISVCPARSRELEKNLPAGLSLTFPELRKVLAQKKIDLAKLPRKNFKTLDLDGLPACGFEGETAEALASFSDVNGPEVALASGFDQIRRALDSIRVRELTARFVELNFCAGGCAGSPAIGNRLGLWQRKQLVKNFFIAKNRASQTNLRTVSSPTLDLRTAFRPRRVQVLEPGSEKVKEALSALGISTGPSRFNCGVCGYQSCEDFAKALIRNEAEPDFCFPALVKKMSRIDEKFLRSERLASIGQIAAGLAHEVNNPLGLASGYTQALLNRDNVDEDVKEVLALISEEIQNAASIIQNFLNLSGERQSRFETANFYDVLAATLRLVTPRLEASGVVLNLDYVPGPLTLECDSYGLQQVFTNILLNSWQAMSEGGTLYISVREDREQVTIKFRDTGTGIKPDHLSRVFDPFFTTKPPGVGTGLGLTIAYKVIEQHRGDIQIRNAAGKGTEVMVMIPRQQAGRVSEVLEG